MALVLGILVGILIGYLLLSRRREESKLIASNEYWVYLPGTSMPDQTALMSRLVGDNPHMVGGRNPISPREGLLFSDIRLHVALVLRSKNPHVFRPDLFEEHIEPTAEILEKLASCDSLVKVRYISEQPLKNLASVQLLPHLAGAVAELGGGLVIYDCVQEILMTREQLDTMLSDHFDLTTPDLQVRPIWRRAERGGWSETRGLRKIGLPELATQRMENDEEVLVKEVLNEAARQIWTARALPERVNVSLFGDDFQVVTSPPKGRLSSVRILRIQAV